jgi:hypothetical protein
MDNGTSLLYIFTDGQDILMSPLQKNNHRLPWPQNQGPGFLQNTTNRVTFLSVRLRQPLFSKERKMNLVLPWRFTICLCLLSLVATGCFYREPVRHLSSDICLITPNLTQQEVLSSLGPPNQKQQAEQGEIWIYYQVKKSMLRKTPYVGEKLGAEDYEVITVTFAGDTVSTCVYRAYNEEELKKSGITISGPRED